MGVHTNSRDYAVDFEREYSEISITRKREEANEWAGEGLIEVSMANLSCDSNAFQTGNCPTYAVSGETYRA